MRRVYRRGVQKKIKLYDRRAGWYCRGYYARHIQSCMRISVGYKHCRDSSPSDGTSRISFAPRLSEPATCRHELTQGCIIMPCGEEKLRLAWRLPDIGNRHCGLPTDGLVEAIDGRAISRLRLQAIWSGSFKLIWKSNAYDICKFRHVQTWLRILVKNLECIIVMSHLVFKDASKARSWICAVPISGILRFGLTAVNTVQTADQHYVPIIGPKFYKLEQDDPGSKLLRPKWFHGNMLWFPHGYGI